MLLLREDIVHKFPLFSAPDSGPYLERAVYTTFGIFSKMLVSPIPDVFSEFTT
jgi:hypothetical protein